MSFEVEPSKVGLSTLIIYFLLYVYNTKGLLVGRNFNLLFIACFLFAVGLLVLQLFMRKAVSINVSFIAWIPFVILLILEKVNLLYFLVFLTFVFLLIMPTDDERIWRKIASIFYLWGVFHATGVYLQLFFPGLMSNLMSFLLSSQGFSAWKKIVSFGYRSGFTHQTSHTALYLLIGILCLLYAKNYTKIKRNIMLIFFVIPLLLQGKRTHLVLMVLLLICAHILMEDVSKRLRNILIGMGIALSSSYLMVQFLPMLSNLGGVFGRLFSIINVYVESGFSGVVENSGRYNLYMIAIQLFEQNPIRGAGWGSFQDYLGLYYDSVTATHNVYLQLLCEVGIVGLVCFAVGQVTALIRLFICRNIIFKNSNMAPYKPVWKIAFFGELFFSLYCLTGNPLYNYDYLISYLISILLSEILIGISKKNEGWIRYEEIYNYN